MNNNITQEKILEFAYPYTTHKKNLLLSVGVITPNGIEKMCIGENGAILDLSEHSYEIGSITKSFVASLVASLVERDIIHLSDEVLNGVKLYQLLTHSSGIEEYPIQNAILDNPFSCIFKSDIDAHIENVSIDHNQEWSYSNLGFALIGTYLERKLNRTFPEILEEFIRDSLHLGNTRIGYSGAELIGNTGTDTIRWCWDEESVFLPAGCLVSTLSDMISYVKLHMTDNVYSICHDTHLITGQPFDMGLAFMKQKESDVVFCGGLTPGFSSVVGFDKDKRYGVAVLSNYYGFGYGNRDVPMGIGISILEHLSENNQSSIH